MTGRDEHRIPATRFHDSLRGRRARRICREIWNLVVGARARGSFEDVVVRRAPGFTTASSIERERRERIHIEKKASEREKRVLASLARVRSRCESQENVRNGYWSQDEIPSGNIVPFLPFYLNDPSHGGGREGVRPPKSQLAAV